MGFNPFSSLNLMEFIYAGWKQLSSAKEKFKSKVTNNFRNNIYVIKSYLLSLRYKKFC